jgi:amino-acid N-acetyltransferase
LFGDLNLSTLEFSIRKAKLSDFTAIDTLVKVNPKTIVPRREEEYQELIESFWVAEIDNQIVGCVCLEVYSRKICEIRTLIVKDSVKGQGIGKALMQIALEQAKKQNIPQILVITSDPEYFAKLGFGSELNEKYALFYQAS